MKQLTILGATGSIGRNTLKIVEMFPQKFKVVALAAKSNVALLAEQIRQFKPRMAVVYDKAHADALKALVPSGTEVDICYGESAYCRAAEVEEADTVVSAMVGAAGLKPTLAAIEAGKAVALANKETLVMAGEIVMQKAAENGVRILPIDSEHSAIFQALLGNRPKDVRKIFLTASGGPFFGRTRAELADITRSDALNHPNWRMGPKISIDSATMMNKGLEVIEAQRLFGVSIDSIEVVIHRQSVIHSMVSYRDGSVMAQMGVPDMKGAIALALSYPKRLPIGQPEPDFVHIGTLTFDQPDMETFPCLALAYRAGKTGGSLPAVLNAANEIAVTAFLENRLPFLAISETVCKTMDAHTVTSRPDLAEILAADDWARRHADKLITSAVASQTDHRHTNKGGRR